MKLHSFYLASNRGSYEESTIIKAEFDNLLIQPENHSGFSAIEAIEPAQIQQFIEQHPYHFMIGFIGYDMGLGITEPSGSKNQLLTSFPSSSFFAIPDTAIQYESLSDPGNTTEPAQLNLTALTSKSAYIQQVESLQHHIQIGDIYEVNYCISFVAENISLDPYLIFQRLNQIAPMPFSALMDTDEFAIISASPERFIKKKGNQLIAQPMKGTKARVYGNEENDKLILKNDPKERAENVMIVDLTRNDLSKLAKKGTVEVDELYGVYSFPTILQMISTIRCEIDPKEKFENILYATFPMGSMTGAPKKRAMQLIDKHENFARGPFSGMLGYIDPKGDFDFSVLIRTIFYDKVNQKLFVAVGSAITCQSNVEKEYEECLIKLQPLLQALNASIS